MPADDPYRTLGLERSASLDEVKRAYRRLVKANHPDAAGEAALPRFLAIQDAYDRIVGPEDGNGRVTRGSTTHSPWEADPDRAGATYRAYGGRARPRPGPRTGPRRPSRPAGSAPPKGSGGPASPGATEQPGATSRPPSGDGAPSAGERRRKKATLGSTSYDDVDPEAFSPDWGGASWYGTTSGTYWTINPKEYADPRKHGPEYQARARRAGRGPSSGARDPGTAREAPQTDSDPVPPDATIAGGASPASAPPRSSPPPTHTTSSWWEATAGEPTSTPRGAAGAAHTGGPAGSAAAGSTAGATSAPRPKPEPAHVSSPPVHDYAAADLSTDAVFASIRRWLDDDQPTGVARIGRAVIGWAPIALGAGWLAGEVSGCGRFAATCPPVVDPLTWVVQLGALLLLILLPRLARITTIGTIAILGTVFPASLLLFATGDPEGMAFGRSLLGGLIIVAWIVGLGYGILREVRRGVRPVS